MKRSLTIICSIVILLTCVVPIWGQTPSTEGQDFWVTFLRRNGDSPKDPELKLTFSSKYNCQVTVNNPTTGYNQTVPVTAGTAVELTGLQNNESSCYSETNETKLTTALHVTATAEISLFAGNYAYKSFDATNVLPVTACRDHYIIQTYPATDHEGKTCQGSHFAIIALEDSVVVDYKLTVPTAGNRTGTQTTPTLMKGEVWYVWSGMKEGDSGDLSGTEVTARDGKKIAVFQGNSQTNIPYAIHSRDHLYSQAMPVAYWGNEFVLSASKMHARDKYRIMAINDGTEVYINSPDGEKELVYTFDFFTNPKHFYEFEIGDYQAYCIDKKNSHYGQLPPPLITDSSCYLTTSCPVGVHLFMVSAQYDSDTYDGSSKDSDPAMLWISPIEQVIKEINFATYQTAQAKYHFVNVVTATSNVPTMTLSGKGNIASYFHPVMGNPSYSFARIEIPHGSYNLKGKMGFLAHVYGYGVEEGYAYSCGSSTVERSISMDDEPVLLDSVSPNMVCINQPIEMKLSIGSNSYSSILWDYGDGITQLVDDGSPRTSHTYTTPGWYDLIAHATYINTCGARADTYTEDVKISFYVNRPDTVKDTRHECVDRDPADPDAPLPPNKYDTIRVDCDTVYIYTIEYGYNSAYKFDTIAQDEFNFHGKKYVLSGDYSITLPNANAQGCDSTINFSVRILTCLALDKQKENPVEFSCETPDILTVPADYIKGDIGHTYYKYKGDTIDLTLEGEAPDYYWTMPIDQLKPGDYKTTIYVEDTICDKTLSFTITFTKQFPAEQAFRYKFNNVLALYNADHNGGYEFVAYQWYVHHAGEPEGFFMPIPGATNWMYTVDSTFTVGDQYYVKLTEDNGAIINTCPYEILTIDYAPAQNNAPAANKQLENGQLRIRREDTIFNIYGLRVR